MKEKLVIAIADMKEQEAIKLAKDMIAEGVEPQVILDAGKKAMEIIGERFEKQEYYLPELILAGEMMKQLGDLVKPVIGSKTSPKETQGKVVIGTVAGDIHDIGKDIVAFMLEANNFEVYNLGVDVSETKFVEKILEVNPEIVGMSGFLTLAYDQMKKTVEAIKEAGIRDRVKIMIGGTIMNKEAAVYTGADAYGADATDAVKLAKSWTGGK